MSNSEIALQLTLKVMDKNLLQIDEATRIKENEINQVNEINAKQIINFYNNIYENIKW